MMKRIALTLVFWILAIIGGFLLSMLIDKIDKNKIPEILSAPTESTQMPTCDQGYPSKPDYKVVPYTCEGK